MTFTQSKTYEDAPPPYEPATSAQAPAQKYEFELHQATIGPNLHIKQNDSVLYYVGHYQGKDSPDIIFYGGYDHNGPRLAQASYIQYSKDFKVFVGDHKTPSKDDWDIVRCANNGAFSHAFYRFETRAKTGGQQTKSRYYWTKTSDSKLGASHFSPRDFKLVDESDEAVVAVYVEHHLGSRSHRGTIHFRRSLDERAEIVSMMVLLSLLDKSRRQMRAVAMAFPDTNSNAIAHSRFR